MAKKPNPKKKKRNKDRIQSPKRIVSLYKYQRTVGDSEREKKERNIRKAPQRQLISYINTLRTFLMMISFTSSKTARIWFVSVAHVTWE